MKIKLVLVFVALLSGLASATEVPHCLKDGGKDANGNQLFKGAFRLTLDAAEYNKPKLLKFLAQFRPPLHVYGSSFPLIYKDTVSFSLLPTGYSSDMTFEEIIELVSEDVAKLQKQTGVNVGCETVFHPGKN